MKCENCQYHTSDGRCLYFAGCPYRNTAGGASPSPTKETEAAP